MTAADIIEILRAHERIVYLPKGARKNPLTQGIIRSDYEKIAAEIAENLKTKTNGKADRKDPAQE